MSKAKEYISLIAIVIFFFPCSVACAQTTDTASLSDRRISDLMSAIENNTVYMESYTLYSDLPDGKGPEMQYDCISFVNGWPESIMNDMEGCFPDVRPLCGIYYDWKTALNDIIPITLFAFQESGNMILAGVQYRNGEWLSEIISNSFFDTEDQFAIAMMPQLRMDESISSFAPAVIHNTEWFDFMPTPQGFIMSRYERILEDNEYFGGKTHYIINVYQTAYGWDFESYYFQEGKQFEIGTYELEADAFAFSSMNMATFPRSPEEIIAMQEPNG